MAIVSRYSNRLDTPAPCLGCGKVLDAAAFVKHAQTPEPGDISVCFYCGHIAAFANDLTFRELTDTEMHAVAGDADVLRVQSVRTAVWSKTVRRKLQRKLQ